MRPFKYASIRFNYGDNKVFVVMSDAENISDHLCAECYNASHSREISEMWERTVPGISGITVINYSGFSSYEDAVEFCKERNLIGTSAHNVEIGEVS